MGQAASRNKNSWILNFRFPFLFPAGPWYDQANWEVAIQMHQNSDNHAPRVPTRWLARREAQSGLSLASFGLYIYLLRLHFPPSSGRITIAQAASETRGISRKVVRSFLSLDVFICIVLLFARGGYGRDRAPCGSEIYSSLPTITIGQAFEILDPGSSPLARFPPPAGGSGEPVLLTTPPPNKCCSTSPQKGSPANPRNLGAGGRTGKRGHTR